VSSSTWVVGGLLGWLGRELGVSSRELLALIVEAARAVPRERETKQCIDGMLVSRKR
jgi:hypothetical protein